jgi:hypothetical protein
MFGDIAFEFLITVALNKVEIMLAESKTGLSSLASGQPFDEGLLRGAWGEVI